MPTKIVSCLLFCTLMLFTSMLEAKQKRTHEYRVKINPELTVAQVNICFEGKAPEYLIVDYRKATKNLIKIPKTNGGYIEFEGRYWKTQSLSVDSCINYKVNISDHNRSKRYNVKGAPLSYFSENSWLWLPEKIADDETVVIDFDVPPSYRVSAPWLMLNEKGTRYQIGKLPQDWGFTVVVGEFDLQTVSLSGGGKINIAILENVRQKEQLVKWVKDTGETLASYLGYFPVKQLQVVMIQSRKSYRSPVPWGEVKRGGGFGVVLVVASERKVEDFYKDWTITHEFSHLLVPNIQYKDIWLSEGLASYLQYVLMARAKHLSPEQTWQRLYEGFKRGIKGTKTSAKEQLVDTVKNRRRGGGGGRTKRIYWSGAAYFFLADIQLREKTNGNMDLPKLLAQLNQCCIQSTKEWSGIEFSKKLDELSDTTIFSNLYQEIAYSYDFPDVETAYTYLGMSIDSGQVLFDNSQSNPLRSELFFGSISIESPSGNKSER